MRSFFRTLTSPPDGDGDLRFFHVMRALGVLTFLCFALASAALIANYYTAASISADRKTTWHAVICAIEKQEVQNPFATYAQTRAYLEFLDGVLVDDVHAKPCGLKVDGR